MTRGSLESRQRLSYTHSKDNYDSSVTTILKIKRTENVWGMKCKEKYFSLDPHFSPSAPAMSFSSVEGETIKYRKMIQSISKWNRIVKKVKNVTGLDFIWIDWIVKSGCCKNLFRRLKSVIQVWKQKLKIVLVNWNKVEININIRLKKLKKK